MGSIKDKNSKDPTEAEVKKRWQEYTEELYKNGLNGLDNHNGVVTHLEPDILEYEVKWALGRITMNKASGGDEIPVELFQILNDEACKSAALTRPANLESSAVVRDGGAWWAAVSGVAQSRTRLKRLSSSGHRTEKGQCSSQCQRRAMPKNVQTTIQLYSFYIIAR